MKTDKFKERFTDIDFPVVRYSFTVIATNDIGKSYLNKYQYQYSSRVEPAAMHVAEDGSKRSTIFISHETGPEEITHECYHGIRAMQRNFSNDDDRNEEWEAYHLGYLVGKVHEFINAKKQDHRPK